MRNKIFLDSVKLSEIERFRWLICGVTTTPTFFKRENIDYEEFITTFRQHYPDLEIHIEALGSSASQTKLEIEKIISKSWFDSNKVVLKIPVSEENLELVSQFGKQGVRFNTHLIFTPNQVALAAISDSAYVCPLIGRYADNLSDMYGENLHGGKNDIGWQLLKKSKSVVDSVGSQTKIMASSIRKTGDVFNALDAEADVITIPTEILIKMFTHPYTTEGIDIFKKDMGLIE